MDRYSDTSESTWHCAWNKETSMVISFSSLSKGTELQDACGIIKGWNPRAMQEQKPS